MEASEGKHPFSMPFSVHTVHLHACMMTLCDDIVYGCLSIC